MVSLLLALHEVEDVDRTAVLGQKSVEMHGRRAVVRIRSTDHYRRLRDLNVSPSKDSLSILYTLFVLLSLSVLNNSNNLTIGDKFRDGKSPT